MSNITVSGLVPTYAGDNANELRTAIKSLLNQTRQLDELVVVEDGPLTEELIITLDRLENESNIPLIREKLSENIGQGGARREGVKRASCDLIAFHDADDIAVPNRIEQSLKVLLQTGSDLVGGYIEEFEGDPENPHAIRKVPCDPVEIRKYAKFRSPINQTAALARKKSILEAGNYRAVNRMEDYELWVRMLMTGHELRNIPEVLAKVRAGRSMYNRRGGIDYAREEVRIQQYMVQLGFISRYRALYNILARVGIRLLPNSVRGYIYRNFLRE
ncbi:glycosyltransferase [Haloarcula sp. S1AR25-5A]|uniref:Glycosyltransferase n=1 Tax=Haloarcula terrestris TaxID=2950533 RepID=A0AAE4EVL6_9EURY|nr:glycosyltransferase [Haloarcula terrestris]MDS0220946.1 glycosyltransferase [Haloarcula terrestris]